MTNLSIIIPTMWYSNEYLLPMLEQYLRQALVGEVILIDNREEARPTLPESSKLKIVSLGENLFVNPSWNLGVSRATQENIVLLNDDLLFNSDHLLTYLSHAIQPGIVIGVGEDCFKRECPDTSIQLIRAKSMNWGFGTCMAMKRISYPTIPDRLKVWYGDNYLFTRLEPYYFTGIDIKTPMRNTSKRLDLQGVNRGERKAFSSMKFKHNVVLILKKGGDFTFSDVDLLAGKLRKWRNVEKVYCLTDMVLDPVSLHGVQMIPFPTGMAWKGWWAKMNLFNPQFSHLAPFLYIDLDSLPLGELKWDRQKWTNAFICLSDFYHPGKLASGMMWIPASNKRIADIWKKWLVSPSLHMKRFRGDQDFLRMFGSDCYWQDLEGVRVTTFKPGGKWRTEKPDVEVVCFHGRPRIPQAAQKINWVKQVLYE